MKKLLLSIALPLLAAGASAQPFTAATVRRAGAADRISFSVRSECNTRYYLIEGSRDGQDYEILSRLDAAGNTRTPRAYAATLYDTAIRSYRIRQVDNTAAGLYSAVIMPAAATPFPAKAPQSATQTTPIALLK